jgi:hypothetical protein
MDLVTVIGLCGVGVNVLTMLTVLFRWSRWTGIVDTKLAELSEHIHNLPCRSCGALKHQET